MNAQRTSSSTVRVKADTFSFTRYGLIGGSAIGVIRDAVNQAVAWCGGDGRNPDRTTTDHRFLEKPEPEKISLRRKRP